MITVEEVKTLVRLEAGISRGGISKDVTAMVAVKFLDDPAEIAPFISSTVKAVVVSFTWLRKHKPAWYVALVAARLLNKDAVLIGVDPGKEEIVRDAQKYDDLIVEDIHVEVPGMCSLGRWGGSGRIRVRSGDYFDGDYVARLGKKLPMDTVIGGARFIGEVMITSGEFRGDGCLHVQFNGLGTLTRQATDGLPVTVTVNVQDAVNALSTAAQAINRVQIRRRA